MSLDAYLRRTATLAVIGQTEKDNINRSINFLSRKLREHFGAEIIEQKLFVSYTRGTILPRYMDERSDIDYIVVFSGSGYTPQTYLDKLKRFVERTYQRSSIRQSSPTIQLELNHIRFELVPAVKGMWGDLKIPDNSIQNQGWMDTSPNEFNNTLTQANQNNSNLIKPLVRVTKYWNAKAGYPFASYDLEQKIVNRSFWLLSPTLGAYFCDVIENLELGWFSPQWKLDKIERARSVVERAKLFRGAGNEPQAIAAIKQIIPETVG